MIVSPLFRNKGKLSPLMMKKLTVRGGGIQVNDALERFGWDPNTPVATTVMSLDESSGAVKGVRFETRGQGPEIKFKARELWQSADENVMIKIKFSDLSRLPWVTLGDKRNQTSWMDSSDVEYEAVHGEMGILSRQQMEEMNVNGFCIRFTILPIKVNKALLYGSIVPVSKVRLEEKLEEYEVEESSPVIPAIAMKLGLAKGKIQNGFPLDLLPVEQESDRVGLGHLPLLECIGSSTAVLPKHEDVARQLSRLMRNLNPTNNVNPSRIRSILAGETLPLNPTGSISYEWPDLEIVEGSPEGASSSAEPITGQVMFKALLLSISSYKSLQSKRLTFLSYVSFYPLVTVPRGRPKE